MDFKHLVDSTLGLLLSAHECEVAAMRAAMKGDNGCMQEVPSEADVPVARHGLKDQVSVAKSTTTANEHTSGPRDTGHTCASERGLGVHSPVGPSATGPAWETPAAPEDSDSRRTAPASWFPSTRVMPVILGGNVAGEQSVIVGKGVPAATYNL